MGSDLRRAQGRLREAESDTEAKSLESNATQAVASCMRSLGVEAPQDAAGDAFLAGVGMALFDPSSAKNNPNIQDSQLEQLQRSFSAGSGIGKVLRVVAILVGICRELERRLNDEATERLAASGRIQNGDRQSSERTPFVDLFLVELWRPFAGEGMP